MLVLKTRYEVRMGEATEVPAAADTLDFILHAKTRRVTVNGQEVAGLVMGPNQTNDQILLAPSAKAKPGEYAVTLSATSESGEERQTSVTVVVKPRVSVPNGSTRPPVVLLNGWQLGFSNSCPVATSSIGTFGNLANYLVSDGVPVVYLFDNCLEDANQPVETLGNDLRDFLNSIKYDDGTQVPQIDLVGFSLGGLIARSYLAGLQPNQTYAPPANTLVRKLVLIASPNFGSFVAGNYAAGLLIGSQMAELVPGSAFLWNLATWNQRGDDLHGADAIAIAGNAGSYSNLFSGATLGNASDGLVTLTSASLGFVSQKPSLTRIVPYCHIDPGAFSNTSLGAFACNAAGIANILGPSHPTSQIVRSFLAGTTDWQNIGASPTSDTYLGTSGGTFFALQNTGGGYVGDLTQVTFGSVLLQNGGNAGTIFYTDFVKGTDKYTASSASLGAINCGTLAASVGYFAATRCKIGTAIVSVTPLSDTAAGRAVTAGSAITLNGAFGSQCGNCRVLATPAGSTTPQALTVTSWSNTAIVAQLPASLTGFMTLAVNAVPGNDAIGVVAVSAVSAPAIAVAPATLQYAYTVGGALPADQSISITNGGSGTLAWTATTNAAWLGLSASSGTAPSTVTVTVNPGQLATGTYSGTIQISATGASNSPATVTVTLVVSGVPASLAVTPAAVNFQYTAGGVVPAAQSLTITNGGGGTLSWTASSGDYWATVSPSSGPTPGTPSVTVTPGNLAPGSYTTNVTVAATDASASPVTVPVTLTVQGAPPAGNITSVVNAASYAPSIASATWVAIFGTNLSQITYTWQSGDIANGTLPTALHGVSVTINGVPAYVEYISPTQINVLAPDDPAAGPVQVQVTAAGQLSNSFTVSKAPFAPAFLTLNGTYAAALHLDYSLVGKSNLLPGAVTMPAKPGETILLYGVGFGPTNPPVPTDQAAGTAPLANSLGVTIGGIDATVIFAGLVGPGLYQVNVTVPDLPSGDAAVLAKIAGVATQTGVAVTVQQ